MNAGIEVKGGADGVFGVATSVSIGKFQSAQGLNVTTALDAPTAAALGLIPTLAELGLPTLQAFPVQGRCGFTDSLQANHKSCSSSVFMKANDQRCRKQSSTH
ncbi:MAG: peptidoglycan-binding domain-containing protein [Actinomycetes bacterium]